jgi:uncharacterized protein YxjI
MLRQRRGRTTEGEEEATHRYKMKEKLIDIGDDYWIEDEGGNKAFKVDGKLLRMRNTLTIKSHDGEDLYKIQEKWLHIKDSMEIEKGSGGTAAIIKKALVSPLRDRWSIINKEGGSDMKIKGNFVNHEYRIEAGRDRVAEISKKWFRIRDTYGVEIEPGYDDAFILAITAAIDQMAHD